MCRMRNSFELLEHSPGNANSTLPTEERFIFKALRGDRCAVVMVVVNPGFQVTKVTKKHEAHNAFESFT